MLNKLKNMEWASVAKGALIAGTGAALAYASQWASGQDFGLLAPAVTAGFSLAIQFVRKLTDAPKDISIF
jgi:hypothetical protein